MTDIDAKVRLAAFKWLEEQCLIHGDTLSRKILEQGFIFQSQKIHLIGPQGIFIPKGLTIPLSINTSPKSPYADQETPDGYLLYKYRGEDPLHRENEGLRQAMIQRKPLIYLLGVTPGKYIAKWPVFIDEADSVELTFKVDIGKSDQNKIAESSFPYGVGALTGEDARRQYLMVQTRYRLHQQRFRENVLAAYGRRCAMCQLRHEELLDATHIIPDSRPGGEPIVPNGMSLCKLHHAAFDNNVLGVRPDYVIEIRDDVLKEKDGPMLLHGLQSLAKKEIILPRSHKNYPDPKRLEERYQDFKSFIPN